MRSARAESAPSGEYIAALGGYAHGMKDANDVANVPTPALVLDAAALNGNIAAMAVFARSHGLALRPHAKTHKCAEIARHQIAAGAVGICCAKLAEAEALAAEGIDDIHLTSPVVTPQAVERLLRLNDRVRLSVVADHPENVAQLAQAATQPLRVLIDVDPGSHRTGVASPQAAVALARAVARHRSLILAGVQFYCGSQQHIAAQTERRAAVAERTVYLQEVIEALRQAGFDVPLVTGGGTGSFAIDADLGVLTELQVGSYVFMDREYRDCELGGPRFEQSLFVDATVVSANTPGMVTLDAGLKAFAADAGVPVVAAGAPAESRYVFTGDEHGALVGEGLPGLGARVRLVPPHCDPTVNLYDCYAVIEDGCSVGSWPVTARGCST
jgi:D-serine deaminase-like pyridoxal phosphate-dependent protein